MYQLIKFMRLKKNKMDYMNLDLTLNDICNMNCKYCMSNYYSKKQSVNKESIDDFFFNRKIIFYYFLIKLILLF